MREDLVRFTEPQKVLDHGFVRLVDVMGSDEAIESAARLSYKGQRKASDTRSLLRYLIRHRHTSPLEQAVISLEIKLPIFVARQLVRHRTQSLNEVSARYTQLPDEFYIPEEVHFQSSANKQGRSGVHPRSAEIVDLIRGCGSEAYAEYEGLLSEGVARETARMVLPVNVYTHWVTTMNLHNLLHLLKLRLDPHAQYEIRVYAEAIAEIVKVWCPIVWEAFEDYVLHAHTFSRQEMDVIRLMAKTFTPDEFEWMVGDTLSGREKKEFLSVLWPSMFGGE